MNVTTCNGETEREREKEIAQHLGVKRSTDWSPTGTHTKTDRDVSRTPWYTEMRITLSRNRRNKRVRQRGRGTRKKKTQQHTEHCAAKVEATGRPLGKEPEPLLLSRGGLEHAPQERDKPLADRRGKRMSRPTQHPQERRYRQQTTCTSHVSHKKKKYEALATTLPTSSPSPSW